MKAMLVAAILCLGLGAVDTWAQEPPAPGRANRPRAEGLTPADVEDMLDALALVQAERVLRIEEGTQYTEFVTRLKALQETRRRNRQARLQIVRELQRLTGPRAGEPGTMDEGSVRDRLRALKERDQRAAAELASAYDALDKVLDTRQQARFRVFELNMERQKLDLLLRARQGAARGRADR